MNSVREKLFWSIKNIYYYFINDVFIFIIK